MTDFVAIEQALLNLQADIAAQQSTVQALIDAVNTDKGAALGTATLDANSRLQPAQHPALSSGQAYIGSAGNVPVAESLISAISSRSTNSANEPLILDGSALVSLDNIPSSIKSGATFKGTWDADTNTPTLTSGVGTNGDWYYVAVAGTTNLDGIADWQKGDIIIFNGDAVAYEKIDGSDAVISVQGSAGSPKQGAVSLNLTEFNLTTNNAIVGVGGVATEVSKLPGSLIPTVIEVGSNSNYGLILAGGSTGIGFIIRQNNVTKNVPQQLGIYNLVGWAIFHQGGSASPFNGYAMFRVQGETATLVYTGSDVISPTLTYNTGTDEWTLNWAGGANSGLLYMVGVGWNTNRL